MEQEVLEVQDLDYNPATNRFFTRRSMEDEVVSGPSMSPLETAENGTTLKTSVPYVGGSFVRGAYEIFKRALKDEPKKIVAFVQKFARTKVLSEEKILKVAQTYLKEKGLQAPPIDVLQSSTDIVEPPGGFSPLTGLPQFGNVLPFVATTAAGKSKNPLILEKDAEESHSVLLRRFPVGADAAESAIFDAGVDLGANFAPVISVVGAPSIPNSSKRSETHSAEHCRPIRRSRCSSDSTLAVPLACRDSTPLRTWCSTFVPTRPVTSAKVVGLAGLVENRARSRNLRKNQARRHPRNAKSRLPVAAPTL